MPQRFVITSLIIGSLVVSPFMMGCQNLPGDERSQGAVIGGLGGAAAGALIGGRDNRLLGALIGGAAGAGGGYLIGANWDRITGEDREGAQRAHERAQETPATVEDVDRSRTADLNNDGFVTLDEVVAMQRAGLSDREMIRRLERTQQYFELTREQEDFLLDRGVSRDVVFAMRTMNPEMPRQAAGEVRGSETIGAETPR
jgi:hypothetical protein